MKYFLLFILRLQNPDMCMYLSHEDIIEQWNRTGSSQTDPHEYMSYKGSTTINR